MAVNLLALVSRHNHWLTVRQSLVASNIANANAPGYKAQDVQPFEKLLDSAPLQLAVTHPAHLSDPSTEAGAEVVDGQSWETLHSGNNVSLEQELIKASEVSNAFRLNTSVAKAFHSMLMASLK